MSSIFNERLLCGKYKSLTAVDDGDIGLVVRYKGAQASATVEVSSAGDITFKHGALSSEVVDTTIDSGGNDPGVIDVSDSNANTFGEVVDLINASANWEAYLVGVLRADSSNASTGSLLEMVAAQAHKGVVASGVRLFKDTSKVLNITHAIFPKDFPVGYERDYNKIAEVYGVTSNNTFGSGTSLIQVYEIDPVRQTATKVFERAGAATTVEQNIDADSIHIWSDQGNYLLVRLIGSAACTGFLTAQGRVI